MSTQELSDYLLAAKMDTSNPDEGNQSANLDDSGWINRIDVTNFKQLTHHRPETASPEKCIISLDDKHPFLLTKLEEQGSPHSSVGHHQLQSPSINSTANLDGSPIYAYHLVQPPPIVPQRQPPAMNMMDGMAHVRQVQHQAQCQMAERNTPQYNFTALVPGKDYPKPIYSYSCLIALSLKNSRELKLTVSEIYSFMCENFPYFRTAPSGWKNSVRHNLSLNKCFEKIEIDTPGGHGRKSCLWTMNPLKIEKMNGEVRKWRDKDPAGINDSLMNIGDLAAIESGAKGMPEECTTFTWNENNNSHSTIPSMASPSMQSLCHPAVNKGPPKIIRRSNYLHPSSARRQHRQQIYARPSQANLHNGPLARHMSQPAIIGMPPCTPPKAFLPSPQYGAQAAYHSPMHNLHMTPTPTHMAHHRGGSTSSPMSQTPPYSPNHFGMLGGASSSALSNPRTPDWNARISQHAQHLSQYEYSPFALNKLTAPIQVEGKSPSHQMFAAASTSHLGMYQNYTPCKLNYGQPAYDRLNAYDQTQSALNDNRLLETALTSPMHPRSQLQSL